MTLQQVASDYNKNMNEQHLTIRTAWFVILLSLTFAILSTDASSSSNESMADMASIPGIDFFSTLKYDAKSSDRVR